MASRSRCGNSNFAAGAACKHSEINCPRKSCASSARLCRQRKPRSSSTRRVFRMSLSAGFFDHNWELVLPLIPMPLVRRAMKRHFAEKVETEILKNLLRLTSQWEETIPAAIQLTEKGAARRFEELVSTVRRLLSDAEQEAKADIPLYIQRLHDVSHQIASPPVA